MKRRRGRYSLFRGEIEGEKKKERKFISWEISYDWNCSKTSLFNVINHLRILYNFSTSVKLVKLFYEFNFEKCKKLLENVPGKYNINLMHFKPRANFEIVWNSILYYIIIISSNILKLLIIFIPVLSVHSLDYY